MTETKAQKVKPDIRAITRLVPASGNLVQGQSELPIDPRLAAEAAAIGANPSAEPMRAAIAAYDRLWSEWLKLKTAHADCPSLYSDTQVKYVDAPPFRQVLEGYRASLPAR